MTVRLYYRDSFVREFDATVTSCEREGDRFKVTLDRTAFYPSSGGQPHDLGSLSGVPVTDVLDASDHQTIVHYTSAELPPGPVRGTIDWNRRLDHMQQHTAQHLLSAVFLERFQFPTISFHLGKELSTIDLGVPLVTAAQLAEAESRANVLVFEDRVVAVRFGTAEELSAAGVRKAVDREGILRAVEIEGVDLQPCGGTHLASTGQVGLLVLRGLERRKDGWRVSFAAGSRALACARADFQALGKASELLSCGRDEVPGVLAKTLEERRSQHAYAKKMEESMANYQADSLFAAIEGEPSANLAPIRVVAAVVENGAPPYLALLAANLTAKGSTVAFLAGELTGHVVMAQTKGGSRDLGALLREMFSEIPGKGGGSRDFAQGTLTDASRAAALVELGKRKLAV